MDFSGTMVPLLVILLAIVSSTSAATAKCTGGKADVVFLMDGSSSVQQPNFNKTLKYVQNVVSGFEVASDKNRIGVIEFSTEAKIAFHLNAYSNLATTLTGISGVSYTGRSTNTHLGIEALRTSAMIASNGGRSAESVPQIGVIITDGQSDAPTSTKDEATKAKNGGIKLMMVCIGDMSLVNGMKDLASSSEYVYKVANFDKLPDIENKLIYGICKEAKGTYSSAISIHSSAIICLSTVVLSKMMGQL